jgi:hypothetical protein
VKSALENHRDLNGPYRLVRHFARTPSDLNNCLPHPISDHSPMTVDFPFNELAQLALKSGPYRLIEFCCIAIRRLRSGSEGSET